MLVFGLAKAMKDKGIVIKEAVSLFDSVIDNINMLENLLYDKACIDIGQTISLWKRPILHLLVRAAQQILGMFWRTRRRKHRCKRIRWFFRDYS